MQAYDLFKYRDKIIYVFRDGTFTSKYFKKSDDAAYVYVLEDVYDFIQKLNQCQKKII